MQGCDSIKAYMRDIANIPLISRDEEVELAARIHAGDTVAKQKLVRSNLRLVVKIAHDFKGMGLPLQDLVAEGNIGLMRAAEKFDPAKGAKFSSYAAWWIKQAMRRALTEKSRTIRVPVASVSKINKIKNARQQLASDLGRDPTDAEIASQVDFSERVVNRLKKVETRTVSLQDPIVRGEDGDLRSLIPDESAVSPIQSLAEVETAEQVQRLLDILTPRERDILRMRFGLDGHPPQTLEEISTHIGRTRERVRQIQQRALRKLREQLIRQDENWWTSELPRPSYN